MIHSLVNVSGNTALQ